MTNLSLLLSRCLDIMTDKYLCLSIGVKDPPFKNSLNHFLYLLIFNITARDSYNSKSSKIKSYEGT